MSKPSKAQQIIDFSKTSIFSIGEINQIAKFMDGDIEATLKIARHAEFIGISMHELIEVIFSYGNN